MKPFRFPLQSVQVLRQQKERAAQQRYAAALRLAQEATGQLESASRNLAAGQATMSAELERGSTAPRLVHALAWCGVLEARQKERAAALEKARTALGAARGEMLLAMRDRETLDRFRDRCRRDYDRESNRQEQKWLDEIATRRGSGGCFHALKTNKI